MFQPPKPLTAVREKLAMIKTTGQDLAWYASGPPRAHGMIEMEGVIDETINDTGNIIYEHAPK